jgi:hypothetical protein
VASSTSRVSVLGKRRESVLATEERVLGELEKRIAAEGILKHPPVGKDHLLDKPIEVFESN